MFDVGICIKGEWDWFCKR